MLPANSTPTARSLAISPSLFSLPFLVRSMSFSLFVAYAPGSTKRETYPNEGIFPDGASKIFWNGCTHLTVEAACCDDLAELRQYHMEMGELIRCVLSQVYDVLHAPMGHVIGVAQLA